MPGFECRYMALKTGSSAVNKDSNCAGFCIGGTSKCAFNYGKSFYILRG